MDPLDPLGVRVARSRPKPSGVVRNRSESSGVVRSRLESSGVFRSRPESSGFIRNRLRLRLLTTPNSSGRLRTTPNDFGLLRTTPNNSGRFWTIPDNSERLRMIYGVLTLFRLISNLSESDRSRLRIYNNFTHHYWPPSFPCIAAANLHGEIIDETRWMKENYVIRNYVNEIRNYKRLVQVRTKSQSKFRELQKYAAHIAKWLVKPCILL